MKSKYFIGIDTSAYTTSIAVIDEYNNLICDYRKVLNVKKGSKGLRQQEAIFQHIKNIPDFIEELSKEIDMKNVQAVGVSYRPRNIDTSYMPVFLVSQSIGKIISSILNVPFKEFSHQEGHIAAGVLGCNLQDKNKLISLHISGGTTEVLLVTKQKVGFDIKIIGGTKDISFGQFIDRLGVKLGIDFPCGKDLEVISTKGNVIDSKIPLRKNDDTWFNLSGLETFFIKVIDSNKYLKEDICKSILYTIKCILFEIINNSINKYNINDVLIVGGVASNKYIKYELLNSIEKGNLYFPCPNYCNDNAIGVSYLSKS